MISNREIHLQLHHKGAEIIKEIQRGCPQGGILSLLLWNITLNLIIKEEGINPAFLQAFADDLVLIVVTRNQFK